jgi:hypothetical protein
MKLGERTRDQLWARHQTTHRTYIFLSFSRQMRISYYDFKVAPADVILAKKVGVLGPFAKPS